jgi:hypothetical protein
MDRAADLNSTLPSLRTEPVRREEVLINSHGELLTMPLGTFEVVKAPGRGVWAGKLYDYAIGEPVLWAALLDELQRGYDRQPGFLIFPELVEIQQCWECKHRFLRIFGNHDRRSKVVLCSNECSRRWRNWRAARRRFRHPPDYQLVNAARRTRRAEARAGRVCAHCGVTMEAARSTKRFCSDICRVRASRSA